MTGDLVEGRNQCGSIMEEFQSKKQTGDGKFSMVKVVGNMQANQSISGVIERITYVNQKTVYSKAKLKSRGYFDLITIVGSLPSVNVGAIVSLKGEWKVDSKYGRQFVVSTYEEKLPATIAGIQKYLGSGLIKGIGPVNAKTNRQGLQRGYPSGN